MTIKSSIFVLELFSKASRFDLHSLLKILKSINCGRKYFAKVCPDDESLKSSKNKLSTLLFSPTRTCRHLLKDKVGKYHRLKDKWLFVYRWVKIATIVKFGARAKRGSYRDFPSGEQCFSSMIQTHDTCWFQVVISTCVVACLAFDSSCNFHTCQSKNLQTNM